MCALRVCKRFFLPELVTKITLRECMRRGRSVSQHILLHEFWLAQF